MPRTDTIGKRQAANARSLRITPPAGRQQVALGYR